MNDKKSHKNFKKIKKLNIYKCKKSILISQ